MGTPDFALPAFQALLNDPAQRFELCLVVSKPDAPAGRGFSPQSSIISQAAQAANIELLQPQSLCLDEHDHLVKRLAELDLDFTVVTAYGMLLTAGIIQAARLGTINIHGSLLPRWRGAAPIERAILAGDTQTGVSIQAVRVELDSGPVYASAATPIGEKTSSELSLELAQRGAELLVECLPRIATGELVPVEQDARLVTYAAKLLPNELALDPTLSTEVNLRQVQAANQRNPARARIAGRGVRILQARAAAEFDKKRLLLATVDGWLEVLELLPDGRRRMSGQAFLAGLPARTVQPAELPAQPADQPISWEKWG
jgi:methionyl-tRNA formyltransferase